MSKQRNQKILLELASLSGNNICADCKARLPRWASYNLGIFLCMNCASIHRKIGTHITKVKSLTMDDWTKDQVEHMKSIGNINSNRIFNPNETRNPPPPNLEDTERDSEIEQYIRAKYQYRKFFDRSALVASKLGPPRSASLAQVPESSAPLSQPAPPVRSSIPITEPHISASPTSTSSYPAPPNPPQLLPTVRPHQPAGGVWDDIGSLNGNTQNSSLPLQYQTSTYSHGNYPMQPPAVSGAMGGTNNYPVSPTPSGMGLNPYQSNQVRTNPFAQQQSQPHFPPPSLTPPYSTTPPMGSQPYGQQSYGVSRSSPSSVHQPAYNPQPQIQNSSGQGFISGSPNHILSALPPGQAQFLPQSHTSSFPQQQYNSQQMQSSSAPPFMYSSATQAHPQMGGHNVSGQSPFLGMTTMQMQQQQQQMQQQQYPQQMHPQQMHPQQHSQQHSQQMHSQQMHPQQHPQQMHPQQMHPQQHPQQMHQQQMHQQQQSQQMPQQLHQQQLGQNYYSSMQPQVSGPVGSYGQPSSVYPQGSFPSQNGGGQWGTM